MQYYQKMSKGHEDTFHQRGTKDGKYMKKSSPLLTIREM